MLGNTLRSWSGWTDPSTACTCECANQPSAFVSSDTLQPISPQTADDLLRSSSSDTHEQLCAVSSISSHSITVITGEIIFSFPLQWSSWAAIRSVEIFALSRHSKVKNEWVRLLWRKGGREVWAVFAVTLSYTVDSFTPCSESQWSGLAADTVWFSNAVCKLLHFESTNNIVIFRKMSFVMSFFFMLRTPLHQHWQKYLWHMLRTDSFMFLEKKTGGSWYSLQPLWT